MALSYKIRPDQIPDNHSNLGEIVVAIAEVLQAESSKTIRPNQIDFLKALIVTRAKQGDITASAVAIRLLFQILEFTSLEEQLGEVTVQ